MATVAVNIGGQQFLAGTTFTLNEDRGRAGGNRSRSAQYVLKFSVTGYNFLAGRWLVKRFSIISGLSVTT